MNNAPYPPLSGTRQQAIDRAWKLEVDLVLRAGRGTRPWSAEEIQRIRDGASYSDLGYTGHHINRVRDRNDWRGDPRNIVFARQGSGEEHMVLGHPGGTQASQPERLLIDREAMLRSLGGGVIDAR
ncbi:MAG: hypothetical protein KJ062_03575 [Thermoanaerobaculia bacterium]|nr:hypothetical protein [Thermoanaerobaculia bacterium]